MIAFLLRWWRPLAAVALALAVWTHGYRTGDRFARAAAAEALLAAQRETMRAADLASRREVERLAAEAEARRLGQELEDAAYADPVRVPDSLGVDRVRRLNRQ